MLLDAQALAIVAALGMLAAVVGGMGGFGTGIILTAALAPFIGVKAVIPVLAVAGAIINAGRFWFYRRSLQRRALALVLACALPFLVLGTWIYSALDARAVGTVLGIVVLASVPLRRALNRRKMALGVHLDGHGDRGAADALDVDVEGKQVADLHRLLEDELLDRHGGDAAARQAPGNGAAGDVDLRHDPAAEDVAVLVRVGRHRHDAQRRQLADGQDEAGRLRGGLAHRAARTCARRGN